jgi:RimJ/RimL family protein N-acetyltransferase
MAKQLLAALCIMMLTAVPAPSAFATTAIAGQIAPAVAHESGEVQTASLLFVFEGRDAKIRPRDNSSFELAIPIRRSNHLVTWFTDRPTRDAGHITMEAFIGLWNVNDDDSFKNDPPNVALELDDKTLIATMTEPRIRSTKTGDKTLVTRLTLLRPKALAAVQAENGGLAAHAKRAGRNSHSGTINIQRISCFVDDDPISTIVGAEVGSLPLPPTNAGCKTLMQYYGLCFGASSNNVCPCP